MKPVQEYLKIAESLTILQDQCSDLLKLEVITSEKNLQELQKIGFYPDETIDRINAKYLKIDLDQDGYYIRKTKKDFLNSCHLMWDNNANKFKKDVVILEDKLVYLTNESALKPNLFFDNVRYSFIALHFFKKSADFDNPLENEFILLSSKEGKKAISYKKQQLPQFEHFFSNDKNFIDNYKKIADQVNKNEDFMSFLKDSLVKNTQVNFYSLLASFDTILAEAQRHYQLYKNKFDFEEFEKGLYEAKENYFNTYLKFQSEILSKINYLPFQFGLYVFLMLRFLDDFWGTVATTGLVVVWSLFSIYAVKNLIIDLNDLKLDSINSLNRIKTNAGFSDTDLKEYEDLISKKSNKSIERTKLILTLLCAISIVFFIFCVYRIVDLGYA